MSTAGPVTTITGPLRLDGLIRARAIHAMTGPVYRSVGISADRIAAVGEGAHDLDDLAGPDTTITDAGDLTLLPAFSDSHEHLLEATCPRRTRPHPGKPHPLSRGEPHVHASSPDWAGETVPVPGDQEMVSTG